MLVMRVRHLLRCACARQNAEIIGGVAATSGAKAVPTGAFAASIAANADARWRVRSFARGRPVGKPP
jgi:hypothetical protein